MIDFAGLVGRITGKTAGKADAATGAEAGIATGGSFAELVRLATQTEAKPGQGNLRLIVDNAADPDAADTVPAAIAQNVEAGLMPDADSAPSPVADKDGEMDEDLSVTAASPQPNPFTIPANPAAVAFAPSAPSPAMPVLQTVTTTQAPATASVQTVVAVATVSVTPATATSPDLAPAPAAASKPEPAAPTMPASVAATIGDRPPLASSEPAVPILAPSDQPRIVANVTSQPAPTAQAATTNGTIPLPVPASPQAPQGRAWQDHRVVTLPAQPSAQTPQAPIARAEAGTAGVATILAAGDAPRPAILAAGDAPQPAKPGVLTTAWRMLAPRQRDVSATGAADMTVPSATAKPSGDAGTAETIAGMAPVGKATTPALSAATSDDGAAPTTPAVSTAPTASPLRAIVEALPPVIQSELGAPVVRAATGPSTGDALGNQVIDMGVSGQWIDRMAKEIAGLADGSGHSRFTLSPPHLGRLQVDLWRDGGMTNIRMLTETDEATQRLSEGRSALQADARVAALSLGAITVEKAHGSLDSGARDQGGQRPGADAFGQQADGQARAGGGQPQGQGAGQGNGQQQQQGSDWVSRIARNEPNRQDDAAPRVPDRAADGHVRFA